MKRTPEYWLKLGYVFTLLNMIMSVIYLNFYAFFGWLVALCYLLGLTGAEETIKELKNTKK